MTEAKISKFLRIDPAALVERQSESGESTITGPADFIRSLREKYGILEASWDDGLQLGHATRYGVVLAIRDGQARVKWSPADVSYRPNPSGRRWWKQTKPFFSFAPDVVDRYMLAATFAQHFPEDLSFEVVDRSSSRPSEIRPSNIATGGYVYLVRSQYGVKIGKSVNVKSRTRLFEVKLPFPISVEHYAWFDDYSYAERDLHRKFHAKRLEGEWFDLSKEDVAHIMTLGKAVPVAGL